MKFDIVTIFPKIFDSYFSESILKKAKEKNILEIRIHNLRDYTFDKHKKVDDTPYGGGAGMVMQVGPIYEAVKYLKSLKQTKNEKNRTILFSAKGKRYTQADAKRLANFDRLIFICGRYEGVDERVAEFVADEEISIGDFVLTGGEIPAMLLVDSISRLIPGVLGNPESLKEESFSMADNKFSKEIKDFEKICEYPQYTKPEIFLDWKVPQILLSGNHKEIEKWRKEKSKEK